MAGKKLAIRRAVQDHPGVEQGRGAEAGKHLFPGRGDLAFADDRAEILAEIAEDQEIGVEPPLDAVKQIVGPGVDEAAAEVADVPVERRRGRADVGGDAVESGQQVIGPSLKTASPLASRSL